MHRLEFLRTIWRDLIYTLRTLRKKSNRVFRVLEFR